MQRVKWLGACGTWFTGELSPCRSPPITSSIADCQHATTYRIGDFGGFAELDRHKAPGYVRDSVWCLLNVDPAAEALRLYVGGDGRGEGDPAFKVLLQEAYVASNVDEFRRPLKLRERLKETEGPVHRTRVQM